MCEKGPATIKRLCQRWNKMRLASQAYLKGWFTCDLLDVKVNPLLKKHTHFNMNQNCNYHVPNP